MVGFAARQNRRLRGLSTLDAAFALVLLLIAYALAFQSIHNSLSRLDSDLKTASSDAALVDYADELVKSCTGLIRCDSVLWSRMIDESKLANLSKDFRVLLTPRNKSGGSCVARFVISGGKPAVLEVCRD